MAGATFKLPGWKWTTDGAFSEKISGYNKKVDALAKDAEAKGEEEGKMRARPHSRQPSTQKDRKAIGEAAGALEKERM